jgi:hypothetical protein
VAAAAGDGDAAGAPPSRRPTPGDRRRAQRAAIAARRAERRRGLFLNRKRGLDDDDGGGGDDGAAPRHGPAPPQVTDPAALAALNQLESAVGRLPPRQAARLLAMAQSSMAARFDAAVASVEADGGGQLAALVAASAAAERAEAWQKQRRESDGGGDGSENDDGNARDGAPSSYQERLRGALVADEALDRAIWDTCLQRALTAPQRAVLERIVAGVPLRRAPQAFARALAGGLDPANRPERPASGGGDDDNDDNDDLDVHAFAIAQRLELLSEADGVHLGRAVAGLASTLAALREASFAVDGAEAARRRFEASLRGLAAQEEEEEEEEDEGQEGDDEAAGSAAAEEGQAGDNDAGAEPTASSSSSSASSDDPLQRRLDAYSRYARLLAEGTPQQARALWYAAGGEPSPPFRALKDVVRRVVEVSLVAPELARHEEGRAEAAARAWREAYEEAGGAREEEEEEEGGGGGGAGAGAAAAQDAADAAARRAADAYDAARPDGAELSRAAERLRAARRALQRRAAGGDDDGADAEDDGDDEDGDDDDEDEASAAAYRHLLAPLSDDEARAALVSLGDELATILAAIDQQRDAAPAAGSREEEEEEEEGGGPTPQQPPPRPTAAGRASARRAPGADARSAALYLAALTDDDGAFDASAQNLARLCTFLRAAEALEALKALAEHSPDARAPLDLGYGSDRGTARGRAAARAVADAFAERGAHGVPGRRSRAQKLRPPATGAEAARLAGLDRDDWWIPAEKRERAWAAVRAAELDAAFAGKRAAAAEGSGKKWARRNGGGGGGRGFGTPAAARGEGEGAAPPSGEEEGAEAAAAAAAAAAASPFLGANPYRALLRFADDARVRELAALDADDLLFLADMERCGWGDDDCLVKWTLHPRVGPRLRATAAPGGGGGGGGWGGDAPSSSPSSSLSLEASARGGPGAFFGGLPDSLRGLMAEARAAAEEERRRQRGA